MFLPSLARPWLRICIYISAASQMTAFPFTWNMKNMLSVLAVAQMSLRKINSLSNTSSFFLSHFFSLAVRALLSRAAGLAETLVEEAP